MGQERFPRAGARHLRSRAAYGKTPGRHDDRSATLSLDWDRGRRITPAETTSQEARSGAELRRWLAATSAAVERRQASALRSARAAPEADGLRRLRKLVCGAD